MDQFVEIFRGLGSPWNMIVLVVLIGSFAGILKSIAKQSRIYAIQRAEMDLKREMVERGLSADEIERVVAAKTTSDKCA